jgi:hypothetical protein
MKVSKSCCLHCLLQEHQTENEGTLASSNIARPRLANVAKPASAGAFGCGVSRAVYSTLIGNFQSLLVIRSALFHSRVVGVDEAFQLSVPPYPYGFIDVTNLQLRV